MDIITYALCKKLISKNTTGIEKIELDTNTNDIIFTLGGGTQFRIHLPIKTDCINIKFVDNINNLTDISDTTIYIQPTSYYDDNNEPIYEMFMHTPNMWRKIGQSGCPLATTTTVGLVKPDGKTIMIDNEGTISVNTNSKQEVVTSIVNNLQEDYTVDDDDITKLFNN